MVEGGMKCIKYALFISNLLFALAGLAFVIAGAFVQTKSSEYFAFFGAKINAASVLLIVVGFVIFTIGFFGCCGAYKENHCMIMAFSVLLGVVLFIEVGGAVAAQIKSQELEALVAETMNDAILIYPEEAVRDAWDGTQAKLMCCGSTNYTDWSTNPILNRTSSLPDSCCTVMTKDCGKGFLRITSNGFHRQGCADKMISWTKSNVILIVGIAIGLALVQTLDVVLACLLARAIKKEYAGV